MSIRWKIVATCLAVVLVPILFLNHFSVSFFDRFTRAQWEEQMIDFATVVAQDYRHFVAAPDAPAGGPALFAARLMEYGREFNTRLRLLSDTGCVLYDSHPDTMVGAELGDRPEVRRALAGRYGARCALTPDRKFMYYFVALPIAPGGRVQAVAYVARHTGPIMNALRRMILSNRVVLLVSLAVAAALSVLLAQTLTRRLIRLTRAAGGFARGDEPLVAPTSGTDEIGSLSRAIHRMAREIESKNTYNRDFLATTAHELKTPLTAIKGAAEALEQGALARPDLARKFLFNIRYETDRLTRLVEELAALTRLDAEELRGRKEKAEWGATLRAMVERLEDSFEKPHATLQVETPAEPLPVLIVPARLEQVLSNLLDNAFRYTPADGRVTVRAERGPDREVLTAVSDTGCGIPAAHLPRVFDRFFTTEPRAPHTRHGSGLGLAIARSIVENHGGWIRAHSEPGRGACFTFSLPPA